MSDNQKLRDVLENGETVLWEGAPQPYSVFGESYKKSTLFSLGLALVWAIFLIGGYIALSVSKNTEIQTGILLFCVAVPVLILGIFVTDHSKVKKLSYAVTDKRALVLSENPVSLPLAEIDAIRFDKADDGHCHVRIGTPAFKASPRKLPILACRGEFVEQDDTKICKGLAFFNVREEDEAKLRNLLQPTGSSGTA